MKIENDELINDKKRDYDKGFHHYNKMLELDISERVLRYYENGDHTMPLEILVKIADYFQVSTDYLLGRTKNKRVYKHESLDQNRYTSE